MEIVCAKCRKPFVKAVRRQGGLDRLLSLAYVYPFRCQVCRYRFHLMQWGLRYIEKDVDRRQYERRPVKIPVRIGIMQSEHLGTVTDLSMGGCAIETPASLHQGDLLTLSLDTFDYESGITIETAVVRSVLGTRVGIEFLWPAQTQKEKERLSRYILNLWLEGTQVARKGDWQNPPRHGVV